MSAWCWSLLVVMTLFGYCVGAYVSSRLHEAETTRLIRQTHDDAYADGLMDGNRNGYAKAWATVEDKLRGLPERYEVFVNDWGPEHGEMRWRWSIFEADAEIDLALWPERFADDEPGTKTPYMLGNEPTRALAEARALAWIAENPIEVLERHQDLDRTMDRIERQIRFVVGRS